MIEYRCKASVRGCAINPKLVQISRSNIILKSFREVSDEFWEVSEYFLEVSVYFEEVSAYCREVSAYFRLEIRVQNFKTSFEKLGPLEQPGV